MVGKDFRTRKILEDLLLQHVCRAKDDMAPFSDLDLAQKLYQFLQSKRFLIVLDDVCSADAWECLRIALLSQKPTASRVLLTTRDVGVADKIASSSADDKGFIHRMRFLNPHEGWELLRKMAFRAHSSSGKGIISRKNLTSPGQTTYLLAGFQFVHEVFIVAVNLQKHLGLAERLDILVFFFGFLDLWLKIWGSQLSPYFFLHIIFHSVIV